MNDGVLNIGFFKLAKNVSKYSNYKIKMGAVIVDKRPIGVGSNKMKTHPKYANPNLTIRTNIHAEMRALINCGTDDLKGCSIFVYRELKNGTPALARPCNSCYNELKGRGIRKIYYTIGEYPYYKVEVL